MRCASCGFENPEGLRFCGKCGTILSPLCPQCGFDNPPGFAFCGKCGNPLSAQPARKRKPKPAQQTAKRDKRSQAKPQSSKEPRPTSPEAERRQLTVLFCDLVGSTALSAQLDPEDYRAVVQQYQQTCAQVIQRHEGYLAQYLGDGLLVYFGYPTAHEDDAARALRTGLGIVEALQHLSLQLPQPLQVRIGTHTGLVVIGEIGAGSRTEQLALGETPNVAARVQSLAEPNTVVVSATTQRLIGGQFECQPLGSHFVKGIETPVAIYHVQSERQGVSPLASRTTLTPLVGREQEVGLLLDRWGQVKEGRGQVVLLSGEPGIGKSRLAYTLREHVTSEGSLLFEARCSPYHQHSVLYPLIDVLQRTLVFTRQDTDEEKVGKLERALTLYNLQEAVPLLTALLSLPTPAQYPLLTLPPQKQKERTLQALLQLLVAQAERQATVSVWEDLHWADPSSLEFLSLLIEQIPTIKLLLVLTFRPEFTPPWKPRSHISQLVLNRLGQKQVEAMIEKVTNGKALSAAVIAQIRVKTDGVPLFVEELTKSVIESVESLEPNKSLPHTPLQLAIPATLQEALMARLDRLSTARQVAQVGATLGREFSYELLRAVSPLDEATLQRDLGRLVEAELLYRRGMPPQERYLFKHALIQDAAYQSLLKSTRQKYHHQIAKTLEGRFPDTKENQPELVAHHYTEAGSIEHALPYWQQAGERATQRSAHVEAVAHLTKGLEVLKALPETPERVQQELTLQLTLSSALFVAKGYAAPEVGKAMTRARALCQQLGETPQLFPVLFRLWVFYINRGELQTARELAEQLMRLAQRVQDRDLLSPAHLALAVTLNQRGELASARTHFEQTLALYDPQTPLRIAIGTADLRVNCLSHAAHNLWYLGYPAQSLKRSQEVMALAEGLSHPYSLAYTLWHATLLHLLRREEQGARERAEAVSTLSTEQGFTLFLAMGTILRGALAAQGQEEEGIQQIQQGMAAWQATGAESYRPYHFALLAEARGKGGQVEEGLQALTEALALVDKTGERFWEAELYRLKGVLALQTQVQGPQPRVEEAEACFLKAIEIARKQQANSLELRATMSLARLWQAQGKQTEAHDVLSEVYHWFTEGFDTKDLQDAKALLAELAEGL